MSRTDRKPTENRIKTDTPQDPDSRLPLRRGGSKKVAEIKSVKRIARRLRKLLPAAGVIWALQAQSWKKSPKMSSRGPLPMAITTKQRLLFMVADLRQHWAGARRPTKLGGRFGFFLFFSRLGEGEGGVRGRREGGWLIFYWKSQKGGGSRGGGAEGPGGCLRRIGESGRGGPNFFFRAEMSTK